MIITDISPKVRALADRLAVVPVGESISFAALSGVAGEDITIRRHLLHSAIRIVQRESGAIFTNERGKGYRRLTAESIPGIGVYARARIRSTARRGSRAITDGLQFQNDVPEPIKLRATAELAALGLVEHLSRDRAVAQRAEPRSPEAVADVVRATLKAAGWA